VSGTIELLDDPIREVLKMISRDRDADTEVNMNVVKKPQSEEAAHNEHPPSDVRTARRDPDTQVDFDALRELGGHLNRSNPDNNGRYEDDEDVRTTVRVGGGLTSLGPSKRSKTNAIDTNNIEPVKEGLRYQLTPIHLGKLERLAKSRFEISQLDDRDLKKWEETDQETVLTIVQSVNASSEIEGEEVAAEQVPIVAGIVTEDGQLPQLEDATSSRKLKAEIAITKAYFWALTRDSETCLTYDFVMELHNRMFQSTRPDLAGILKERDVTIRGGEFEIHTLSRHKAERFLRALCDRTNRQFESAREHSEYSSLLCAAEFVLDFLAIHPFSDGNGRIARLLSTYILEKAGYHFARFYSLDSIILETKAEYYNALFNSQKNWHEQSENLTPWIGYYIDSVFQQWTRAYQTVRDRSNASKRST
jgi:Fic family protein